MSASRGYGTTPAVSNRAKKERGFALFMVLMAVLLLVAAGALLSLHIQARMALVRDQERNMRIQALVDSGYAVAAATSREDYSFDGELVVEVDGGEVRMQVHRLIGFGLPPGMRRLEILATFRGEVRRAEGLYRLPTPGAVPLLFGLEPLTTTDSDLIGFE